MAYFVEVVGLLMFLSLLGGAIVLPKMRRATPARLWLDSPSRHVRYFFRVCLFFAFWLPLQSLIWFAVTVLPRCCDGLRLQANTLQLLLAIGPLPFVALLYRYLAKVAREPE